MGCTKLLPAGLHHNSSVCCALLCPHGLTPVTQFAKLGSCSYPAAGSAVLSLADHANLADSEIVFFHAVPGLGWAGQA